ncbi:MAG TPA: NAD(P)/FAD-dependent oxidoreductase [Kofleriaceae bacterium]|nr:NAD(P)/FAD-dependent oxidoreductase [Kofleriaceae bacterium]
MADRRFDAVVIGGGHHGVIVACYLARAGLTVGVFERRDQLGGGATSTRGPAPGFLMNRFAHWTRFYGHPAYRDFNLQAEGLRYVFPDENQGIAFEDGSSFIGCSAFTIADAGAGGVGAGGGGPIYSQANVDRTREQIRRFSPRDADTYVDLLEKYARYWKPAFSQHRFMPPAPWGTPDPLEALVEDPASGIEPVHQLMTVRQLACDFFESPELRTLFMRAVAISTGCFADDVIGLQGLLHMLPSTLAFEAPAVAIGASQSVSDALVAAGRRLGVEYFAQAEVDEILASGERAIGIQLAQGERVAADLVVSGLGLTQTVLRLMRNVPVDARIVRRLRNIHYDRGQLFSVNVALHEPPRYAAAERNPGFGPQARLLWGPNDPDYLVTRYQPEIFLRGHADRLYAYSAVDTQWDPSRAPEGKHLVAIHEFGAPRRLFSAGQWRAIKDSLQRTMLEQWRRYAPNMTPDNIIAIDVIGPDDVEASLPDMIEGGFSEGAMIASQLGRFRPIPELAQYRTILQNVYTCSSNLHPGAGIGRGSSYNCFQRIAADLGLARS